MLAQEWHEHQRQLRLEAEQTREHERHRRNRDQQADVRLRLAVTLGECGNDRQIRGAEHHERRAARDHLRGRGGTQVGGDAQLLEADEADGDREHGHGQRE
jgi:hypothetical protein